MTPEEFVKVVERVVRDAAIGDSIALLEKPPGRRPRPEHVALSSWYCALPPADRDRVLDVVRGAIDLTVFGFLCVLDGARAIESSVPKGELQLSYVDGGATRLNGLDSPPLHELYRPVR